jgi:hypothetical protein
MLLKGFLKEDWVGEFGMQGPDVSFWEWKGPFGLRGDGGRGMECLGRMMVEDRRTRI